MAVANPFQREAIDLKSIGAQVYEAVKDAIVDGRLAPGQRLTELQLAEQLGVSRSPLREALRRLEAEGFIRRQRSRLLVPSLSRRELEDLCAIRMKLEGLAARQAAQRAIAEEVTELREIQARVAARYASTHRPDEIIFAGTEFHFAVSAMARNPKNVEFIRNVFDHLARYRIHSAFVGKEVFLEDHGRVIAAIAARDADAADAAMQGHVRHTLEQVLARLAERLADEPPPEPAPRRRASAQRA